MKIRHKANAVFTEIYVHNLSPISAKNINYINAEETHETQEPYISYRPK